MHIRIMSVFPIPRQVFGPDQTLYTVVVVVARIHPRCPTPLLPIHPGCLTITLSPLLLIHPVDGVVFVASLLLIA